MEMLIASHIVMMVSIGTTFAMIRLFDRDWRLPMQWAVAFFVLPVGMVVTGSAERQDDNLLRFVGLLGAAVGPFLMVDGFRNFLGQRRALRPILVWSVVYILAAGLVVFATQSLMARFVLVILYHFGIVGWLLWLSRNLNAEDHALSRRLIHVASIFIFLVLAAVLALVTAGVTTIPDPEAFGSELIFLANGLAALAAMLCMLLIAERMAAYIRKEARTDPLTGLATRRYFDQVIGREWDRSRRYDRALSLILFDIDRFKSINDGHGHDVGDTVLHCVANSARSALRPADVMARLGGDEFAILLPETGRSEALAAATRVLDQLRALEIMVGRTSLSVTGSFGVATRRPEDPEPEALIKRADLALYAIKRAGRNGVGDEPLPMKAVTVDF